MFDTLKTLFASFMDICLFRRQPQDLPASNFFLGILVMLSIAFGLLLNLINLPFKHAVLAVILNLSVVAIITQLLLRLHNKSARFNQTLIAQLGTGIVIAIIAAPVIVMLQYAENNNVNAAPGAILWLILFTWELSVSAHILRHALSTSFVQGFMISILYPLIYFRLLSFLIPEQS
ncbi:MAG: hypothetical protein AB8D52_06445 [Gammaproteobacteria bacterium]